MDGHAVDPKLMRSISTTKKLLGKHISKPVLAEKYLGRPPFRFLLEIVNNVIEQTSFMKDVFASKELKYDEVSSAEEKRALLRKVIDAIENETGEKCTARTSKILSGKEPDKTNEMLQLLAKAISSFSSKSRQKVEVADEGKKAASVDKSAANAGDDGGATVDDDKCNSPANKIDDDGGDNKGKDESKSKKRNEVGKTRITSTPVVVSKKSSTATSATASTTAKRKSSEGREKPAALPAKSKSTLVKTTVSPSMTKVSSKESLKGGGDTPSTMTLAPVKKVSSPNIPKSQSRLSLSSVKSASSSSKVQILPEPMKMKQEENLQKSLSRDKLQQKGGDAPNKTALPPETTAEVPLQRPVTRTKYRQKANDAEEAAAAEESKNVQEESLQGKNSITAAVSEQRDSKDNVKDEKKEGGGGGGHGCGLRSGRSSSSEDGVTEHMNLKISEWRTGSAENIKQQQQQGDQKSILTKRLNKTGWITDNNKNEQADTKGQMERVFDSVENCSENDNAAKDGQSRGEAVVSHTPINNVREEVNTKVLKRPITVLKDNESGDEEDDTFVVQETIECERDMGVERQNVLLMNGPSRSLSSSVTLDITYLPPEQRGLLVNQIMETQRELEKLSSGHHQYHHHVMENELAERDKAAVREVYLKQIEDLKVAIQKMSKCANPLANIIQRSQDDSCLMEIEFRKLRQENERLQREIGEAKGETSRILYPLTEELTQLDTRIEKVEGAIVLAKQRLALIDSEYAADFIAQLENTPTVDEAHGMSFLGDETDPILQFRGNFPPHDDDDEDDDDNGGKEKIKKKSLMDVFKRAVDMHEGLSWIDDGPVVTNTCTPVSSVKKTIIITPSKSEKRLLNRTVYGDYSPMGRRTNRVLRQLDKEEPLDKENKPSWWD